MNLDAESGYFTNDHGIAMYHFDTVIEDADFILVAIDEEREVRLLSREESYLSQRRHGGGLIFRRDYGKRKA